MPKKKLKPEQVVTLLRQIEVAVANGNGCLWLGLREAYPQAL
jgi:hypothetical protein